MKNNKAEARATHDHENEDHMMTSRTQTCWERFFKGVSQDEIQQTFFPFLLF